MARFLTNSKKSNDLRALIVSAAESEQKQKPSGGGDSDSSSKAPDGSKKMAKKGAELKEDMDNLMEEIDAVLEENAEEFVKNYVQRGGE